MQRRLPLPTSQLLVAKTSAYATLSKCPPGEPRFLRRLIRVIGSSASLRGCSSWSAGSRCRSLSLTAASATLQKRGAR